MYRRLIVSILSWIAVAQAQEITDFRVERLKHGVSVGPSFSTLNTDVTGDGASTRYRFDLLGGVKTVVDLWPHESYGIQLSGVVGLPAQLDKMLNQSITFSRHSAAATFMYRQFFSQRSRSSAWFLRSVMKLQYDDVQAQSPPVIVSRSLVTPLAGVGFEGYIADRLWYRTFFDYGYPFFMREEPADSGRLDNAFELQASLVMAYSISQRFSLALDASFSKSHFAHRGEATRFGGVRDVTADEMTIEAGFSIRYASDLLH